jgi:hypothetical protein
MFMSSLQQIRDKGRTGSAWKGGGVGGKRVEVGGRKEKWPTMYTRE